MYPVSMDQTRQENPTTQHTLQVHMHHVCCPCSNLIYPYYPPGYRTPILAQPPPIPRPSYLHHYQYTQFHVNPPYNVPMPPAMAQPLPQNIQSSSAVDLAFGPPPRDRRNLDSQDFDEQRLDKKSETAIPYMPLVDNTYGGIISPQASQDSLMDLTAAQVAALSTENYISYLVNGCLTGERIAKRNEHRPCFKNIQNLCNRTRSEVIKPNITVSNIHSQGIPWATKDFIFAFVRAINCWCILRGYLSCKDGSLGKIDREISPEFRSCYTKWEKCTKQLTHYLIETFCKLDEANSPTSVQNNPPVAATSATGVSAIKNRNSSPPQETPKIQLLAEPAQPAERTLNKEMASLKGIPGILHIPPTTSAEIGEVNNHSSDSTEISPRDEDSDSERRVYMKPGSYNVPTKQLAGQSTCTNSPRSVEFLDTAQNVLAYQRKVAAEKPDSVASEAIRDKVWQAAQNITPDFIKQNEEASNIEKLYDVVPQQNNKQIESWLNNEMNRFDCRLLDAEEDTLQIDDTFQQPQIVKKRPTDPSSSRCNASAGADMEAAPRVSKTFCSFRRNTVNTWEYKNGGLTESAMSVLERILRELERDDFAPKIHRKSAYSQSEEGEMRNPTDLNTICKKLNGNKYVGLNEVVHDFRHLIYYASEYFTDTQILTQLAIFREKFEEMVVAAFPYVDFNHVTGKPNEALGILKPVRSVKNEGDG